MNNSKTKYIIQIILGILVSILGWICGGIGFAEPIGPPWNTILFLGGFILIPGGLVWAGISLSRIIKL